MGLGAQLVGLKAQFVGLGAHVADLEAQFQIDALGTQFVGYRPQFVGLGAQLFFFFDLSIGMAAYSRYDFSFEIPPSLVKTCNPTILGKNHATEVHTGTHGKNAPTYALARTEPMGLLMFPRFARTYRAKRGKNFCPFPAME